MKSDDNETIVRRFLEEEVKGAPGLEPIWFDSLENGETFTMDIMDILTELTLFIKKNDTGVMHPFKPLHLKEQISLAIFQSRVSSLEEDGHSYKSLWEECLDTANEITK